MADAKASYKARARYTSAGYDARTQDEDKLYISKVPAGSRQDDLLDFNRVGYQAERPWRDTPESPFETEERREPEKKPGTKKPTGRPGLLGYLEREAQKARLDAAVCVLLLSCILVFTAAWGQKMVEGVSIQNDIDAYQQKTIALTKENERLTQQIEMAKNGERIRNLAQNELHMLRPERANRETIYIRTPSVEAGGAAQQQEKPRLEVLDLLLGMLNLFHIGE